jgi:STE24 endopeptidase
MTFDAQTATATYVDSLGPVALSKAAAYTTGSHWLLLWNLLAAALITWLIVRSGVLDRIAAGLTGRGPNLRAFLIAAVCLLVQAVLSLPWALYSDWWRERSYARTSQPLADFLGQGVLAVGINAVLAGLFFTGIYALLRKAGRRWWLWSGALAAMGLTTIMLLGPAVIEPLFNKYQPVPAGEVRNALVDIARDSGIPTDRLFVFDGSRQSNNFTANVSGIGSSARIAISDVAFKGATLDEVKAVTGHEAGHYVLGHVWRMIILFSLLAVLAFYLADRWFPTVARAFGSKATLQDPTGLPVLLFLISLLAALGQPLTNTISRMTESEADRYTFTHINLPDAMATALVKTAEYRNPRPGRLEEILFYSHPSVERRVRAAMEWKAAHPAN